MDGQRGTETSQNNTSDSSDQELSQKIDEVAPLVADHSYAMQPLHLAKSNHLKFTS